MYYSIIFTKRHIQKDRFGGILRLAGNCCLQTLYPQAKLLFIWDGASYLQYAEMQMYLHDVNQGLEKHEWKVTCEFFAPNAPE